MNKYSLIVILGPTASGKTSVAVRWAFRNNGEIISADSRQVYRNMTIGTGKDYRDYVVGGRQMPCHCIDLVDPGYPYNVYEYQKDFLRAYTGILARWKMPVLCGGSGMYIEAAITGYRLIQVPVNHALRLELAEKSDEELTGILSSLKPLHNRSDIDTRRRTVRAIEIARHQIEHPQADNDHYPEIRPLLIGIRFDRESRRKRITDRLKQRLDEGMIEEAKALLDAGLTPEQLEYYGLEYKYLSFFLTGKITRDEMFAGLNTAIHQFAKRQMTWFRRMERNGHKIWWLDGYASTEEKLQEIDRIMTTVPFAGYEKIT